jgi:hypothetical protein
VIENIRFETLLLFLNSLFPIRINNAPKIKPKKTNINDIFNLFVNSIEGFKRDQKDADNIIPADKLRQISIISFLIFLNRKTNAEPKDVTKNVKSVDNNAKIIGFKL